MKSIRIPHLFHCLLILLASCMMGGCRISYKLNGAAIDYTVYKTIYVSNFPIRAAREHDLLDSLSRNTRVRTVDPPNADLQLEGEITGYNLSPQAVTENAYASRTRLTIQVKIRYIDNKAEGKDIDQTFSAYRDFDSSEMLTDVQDQLCNKISKELVDLIFNATLGDW